MPRVSSCITCQGSNRADYNKTCPLPEEEEVGEGGGGGRGEERCKKCPSHSLIKKNIDISWI